MIWAVLQVITCETALFCNKAILPNGYLNKKLCYGGNEFKLLIGFEVGPSILFEFTGLSFLNFKLVGVICSNIKCPGWNANTCTIT